MARKKQNKKVENTEQQTKKRPIETSTDDNLNPSQVKKMKKNASESPLSLSPLPNLVTNDASDAVLQPTTQELAMQQPSMKQPVMEQPVMEQPVMQQSVMQQPVMQQPVMQQPAMQQQVLHYVYQPVTIPSVQANTIQSAQTPSIPKIKRGRKPAKVVEIANQIECCSIRYICTDELHPNHYLNNVPDSFPVNQIINQLGQNIAKNEVYLRRFFKKSI
jgi:hypothetical protein